MASPQRFEFFASVSTTANSCDLVGIIYINTLGDDLHVQHRRCEGHGQILLDHGEKPGGLPRLIVTVHSSLGNHAVQPGRAEVGSVLRGSGLFRVPSDVCHSHLIR